MKFLKKAVSAFLASVMCIPAGIVNIAAAEENDTNAVTTVTLSDTNNGFMQFSEKCMNESTANQDSYHMVQVGEDGQMEQIENDGSMWAFSPNDQVEIELIPDDGYNVKSFSIKSADTGDVMAHKETMDNVFSFIMPSKSLTVEAVFSDSSTVEIKDELADSDELGVESKYHDITESAEVSQEEVDEVIFDIATESYIKANLNPEYMASVNKAAPVDILGIKQALFDGRHVEEGDSINSIMYSIENGDENCEKNELKVISQINSMAYIYDFDENSDYYVSYANTMVKDEDYNVQDWAFAFNDVSGDVYEGCVYDRNTGLFYIPKELYKYVAEQEGHKPYVMSFQVQFMQVYYDKEAVKDIGSIEVPNMQSDICTVDINEEETAIDVSTDTQDIFDLETVTNVAAGLDTNNMNVSVNGVIIPDSTYEYNKETGELTIAMSSASIISVEAWEGEKTLQDQIKSLTAEEAEAVTYDTMKAYNEAHIIKLNENEIPDPNGKYMDKIIKVKGKLQYTGRKSQSTDPWYVLTGYESGAAPLINWVGNNGSKPVIETKMVDVSSAAGSYYAPMKINLKNYTLRTSSDTWVHDIKKFIKVIQDCWGSCFHVDSPLGSLSGGSDSAPINLRVVKYKIGNKNKEVITKPNGTKVTKWTRKGYMVFAMITPRTNKQTTSVLVKVKFEAHGKDEEEPDPDPMRLFLYKTSYSDAYLESGETSQMSDSTLQGTVYTVKFFSGDDSASVAELKRKIKNNGLEASATWKFKSKNPGKYGSKKFQEESEDIDKQYNESYLELSGVEFNPYNMKDDRSKWNNDFLMNKSEKLQSYRNKWGKKGTYWIYESTPPNGFLKDSNIFSTEDTSYGAVGDAEDGFVVTMKYGNTLSESILKLNGSKTDGVSVVAGKQPSLELYAEEIPDTVHVGSTSYCPDTKTKYAKPGVITIRDNIDIQPLELRPGAQYYITTQVMDKETGEYLDVSWNESATKAGTYYIFDDPSSLLPFQTNVTPCSTDERYKMFGSSLTTKVDAPDPLIDDNGFLQKIYISVEGTVDASGLAGHKLVFINTVHVIDPNDHPEIDEPDDGEVSESGTEAADGGEEWVEPVFDSDHDLTVVTEEDDTDEYIYIEEEPEASTDIMSSQNQRKIGTGESIAYAGKYKDESCKEGGRDILQQMTDTIKYTGLEAGKTYTIKGWLADAETGEKVKDASGNDITIKPDTASQTAAAGGSGTWDVVYEFDGTGFEGRTFVSFIEIYDGNTKKFEFINKDDKKETFLIPEIKTKLIDVDSKTNFTAGGEDSRLVDTITYKNLLPGTHYKVVSKLIDTETEEVGTDTEGNPMECESIQKTENETFGEWEIKLSFDIDPGSSGKTYVAFEEVYIEKGAEGSDEWILVADHKDIMDQEQMTTVPLLTTIARDQKTDYNISMAEDYVYIYDTIHYENLIPNRKYKIISQLVDPETQAVIYDDNGVEQTLETEFFTDVDHDAGRYGSYGDIIPENHDGNGVTFKLNAKSFAGRTVVVYEKLYLVDEGGLKFVIDHQDPLDEKQTIHFPKIWTEAIDVETQTNISYADETAKIKDTISYENLIPGLTYEIQGRVVDRKKTIESGTEVIVAGTDGKNAENKVVFTPDEANGEVELTFDIDLKKYVDDLNKSYAGAVFVVYEDLYVIQRYDGDDARSIVASHTDINDENQTIYLPKITTSLDDAKTGTKLSYAEANAHLKETINYYNFKPNTQYTIKGRLYDMEDGKIVPGSEKEQQFTSNAEGTGSWVIDYNFDASNMKGHIVVAYAEAYIGDKVVATHDEFWDVEERVYFPEITTDAMEKSTGENIGLASKELDIIDTVHYKSLSPGYTYRLVSELRDQATGDIVVDDANNEQVLTTYFKTDFELLDKQYLTFGDIVPQSSKHKDVTFCLDAEYFAGRTLVVYERLYLDNETGEHLIADHQDPLDERQTIPIGDLWTDALDLDTFTKTLHAGTGRATVIDTVHYRNIPAGDYELHGYVVDKDRTVQAGTNILAVSANGGDAKATKQFKVTSSSEGTVKLSFDIDISKYQTDEFKGAVLVVYQELYRITNKDGNSDRVLVATHTDIGNLRQTVYIPYIWTDLNDYKTGTKVLLAEEDAHMVETISYTRFQPNSTYTVKGKIIDMEKGSVLTDSSGKRVEAEMEVTASDTGTGSWDLHYNLDASKLQGRVLVAYADVYVKNGERPDILSRVASHNNFWDTKERVYIPKISTVATDQKTNSHVTFAEDNAWVTDRIYYSHLQPDTEYRLISKLVDKDTQEVVVDDKKIPQEIESTFITTPNESQEKYNQTIKNPFTDSSDTGIGYSYGYIIPADGTTLPDGSKYKGVVFNFDAHTFEGRTLVIYEELQIRTPDGYKTIAKHTDINDENQTVHIPKIRTNAIDSETLTHSSKMDGMITIIDTVTYENLIPGFTYEVEGYLMDKPRDDTKGYDRIKDANGNVIKGEGEFVAKAPNGTTEVRFTADASKFMTDEGVFSSETLVVFERLYLKNNKDASDDRLLVAVHEDINDENQTIYFPRITTKVVSYDLGEEAKDGDADHVIGFATYECDYCKTRFTSGHDVQAHIKKTPACLNFKNSYSIVTEATIYDRVYYENLIPNRTYEIVGHIIDTKTGKAVTINNRMVQSEKKYFTPGTSNGEVDVVFHVTGLDLAGGRYVCYEELFYNGTSIAEHKEKFDDNQTFYVPDMVTSAMDYDTKSNISKADTISTIIDTVEMTGLKENEKYRISSVLMDATTDAKSGAKSSNYGSYFIDGTGNAVHAKQWRKKGSTVWHGMDEYFTIDSTLSPEDYRGTAAIEVKFEVDTVTEHGGRDYQGMTYVVFQELYTENGTLVAQHKDITDKQQTIYVGGMYTVALDGSPINGTMTNLMDGTSGDRTLVDYIYYSNLLPNKSYYVTTNVYIKEMSRGGNPDTDVMQPFEAENAVGLMAHQYTTKSTGSGYWAINISLSGEKLKEYLDKSENGITLVVYEEIHEGTMDGKRVALENNLYNESQSVHIPKIKSTVEEDKVSGLHYTLSEGKWVCDNDECVTYTCDGCGKEFHSEEEAADHLYDCREGDSYTCTSGVFESKAEAEAHVAPVYECNNCKIHFTDETDAEAHVSGRCKDAAVMRATQLVRDEDNNVVNELWYACSACGSQFKTNKECLEHINGSDTCYNYTNINAAHHSYTNINAGVTDTVSYSNLIPGKKYRIQGKIYNTETKEPALTETEEEITSSVTFIPMALQGSVTLDFEFDGTYLAGHKYAVYTEILLVDARYDTTTASTINNPVLITKHNENLDDREEAFYIPKVSTSAKDYYTQTNVTKADSTTTIVDDVTFEGLNTTDKYCIKGIIMDKETRKPLVLADGSQAEATTGEFQVDKSTDGGRWFFFFLFQFYIFLCCLVAFVKW